MHIPNVVRLDARSVGVTTATPDASGSERAGSNVDHDPLAIPLGPANDRRPHPGRPRKVGVGHEEDPKKGATKFNLHAFYFRLHYLN
jgi:hypothetical protein